MLNITDTALENKLIPVLRLAFRPFFLLGCLFSLVVMAAWFSILSGMIQFNPYGGPNFWHSHEMLYGFTCSIIVGFLLTAVQNWTGINGVRGTPLAILVLLWLLPRILMVVSPTVPSSLYLISDCLFLPCAAIFLARPLLAARQARNLFFVPVLLLLTLGNGLSHVGVLNNDPDLINLGHHSAVWLIVLLMTVIGGRVIPFFTANGTGTPKATPLPLLEYLIVGGTFLLFLTEITTLKTFLPNTMLALLFGLTGLLHLFRWLRWRFLITLKVPLLWSLHVGYLFIPVGLMLIAASYVSDSISYSHALHALTAGAMGNMILAMISRVSLGHTGRALSPSGLMTAGFLALIMGGFARSLGPLLMPAHTLTFYQVSLISWMIGFGLFAICYTYILLAPRADGKPG